MEAFDKKTLRKLGFNEAGSKCTSDLAEGHLNIMGFSCLAGIFDQEIFIKALKLVIKKQPLLRARVVEYDDKSDAFEILDELDAIPVEFRPLDESINIKDFVEKEQQRFIRSDSTPLWRCVVLHSDEKTYIFTIVHYLITDGKSSFFTLYDAMEYYEKLYRKEPFDTPVYQLLPNFEEIMKPHQPVEMPDFFSSRLIVPHHALASKAEQRLSKHVFDQIPADLVEKVQIQCNKNNTTMNAFMYAALFLSIDYSEYQQEEIIFGTPIDIRSACTPKVPHDYLGCYRTFVQTTINIKRNNIWQIANQYNNDLWESIEKLKTNFEKNYDKRVVLNEWIVIKELIETQAVSPLFLQLTFSGNLALNNENGILKLTSMHGATIQKLGVTLINVHMAMLNRTINFSVSFSEPLIMEEKIKEIIHNFKALLHRIAK